VIRRPGISLLFANVEDLAGAIAEGIASGTNQQVNVEIAKQSDLITLQLERLNDNFESLLVNGIDVRTHAGICVAPPDDVVMSAGDAVICTQFLADAINSGALVLNGGAK